MAANNTVSIRTTFMIAYTKLAQLDRLVGLTMLIIASTVFLYYTIWTLLIVRTRPPSHTNASQLLMSYVSW